MDSLNSEIRAARGKAALKEIIHLIGDDPGRPGLLETPKRVIWSWLELFEGYEIKAESLFTVFDEPCDEMVILKDIEFTSFCEHHMLPFYGSAHVAYIPADGKVIGVSKLARLVDCFAKRLQIQERICREVTEALETYLKPKGSACMIEAKHMCIACRGVQKQHSIMVTSSLVGAFKNDPKTRSEFFQIVKG